MSKGRPEKFNQVRNWWRNQASSTPVPASVCAGPPLCDMALLLTTCPQWAGVSADGLVPYSWQPAAPIGLLLAQAPPSPHMQDPGPVHRLNEETSPLQGEGQSSQTASGTKKSWPPDTWTWGGEGKGVNSVCPSYRSSLELVGAVL